LTHGAGEVSIELGLLVGLVMGFIRQLALDSLEVVDLISHVSSLDLTSLHIAVELAALSIEIGTHVSLSDALVMQTGSFMSLLI